MSWYPPGFRQTQFASSAVPLQDVVVVSSAELPAGHERWPVQVVAASGLPFDGLPNAYLHGTAEEVEEMAARRPVLGCFTQDFSWEELVQQISSRHVLTLQETILRQAQRAPNKLALIYEDNEWTYQEFCSAACSLRDHLLKEGLDPASGPVGVRIDASDLGAISHMALLSGRFVIHVLDAGHVSQVFRLKHIPTQAVLTTSGATTDADNNLVPRSFHIDKIPLDRSRPVSTLRVHGDLNDVAFLEYTSGSTGKPKGVATQQFRISHWAAWHSFNFPSLGRDAINPFWIWYWHLPLVSGGTCVVWPLWQNLDLEPLMTYMQKHRVARCNCLTPGQISTLLALQIELPSSLKVMISGGEGLQMATARRFCETWPTVELLSNYACTEAAADVAMLKITPRILSIDMPFAPLTDTRVAWNNSYHIEDEELVLQGWNVAHGYMLPTQSDSFWVSPDGLSHRYRTGDRVQMREGFLFITGRVDKVVKVRGYRVDLDGLEANLAECRQVTDLAALKHDDNLYCVVVTTDLPSVQAFAEENYAHWSLIVWIPVDSLPRTKSGKKDRTAILMLLRDAQPIAEAEASDVTERRIAEAVEQVLGRSIGRNVTFTQAGAHSLAAMRIAKALEISTHMLFAHPTVAMLAKALTQEASIVNVVEPLDKKMPTPPLGPLAVTSMGCRVPGGDSLEHFWAKLKEAALMTTELPAKITQIPRKGVVPDLGFDCNFWSSTPAAAAMLDTAQRTILEVAYEAMHPLGMAEVANGRLEGAKLSREVGVIVCGGSLNHWPEQLGVNLEQFRTRRPDEYFNLEVGTDKDYLATSIAYRFNLTGPAEVVQTACSSALVAIARAVHLLKTGGCETVLSGGASFSPDGPITYVDGLIWAKDGVCKPYAQGANGTTNADGAGVVLLSLPETASAQQHPVFANVRGAAVNNDGARKSHFSAPSYLGQVECLSRAFADAGIQGSQLDYVEGHGTGTKVGDPLEVQGLTKVLGEEGRIFLGSVKGNVGHLNTAAGVPGFIKTVLMLNQQMLVPSLHAETPTKEVKWERTSLLLASQTVKFDCRLAGVSSFGVGGTNAHVVLGYGGDQAELQRPVAWARTPVRELLAAVAAPGPVVAAPTVRGESVLEEWFYKEGREPVRLSQASLSSAAMLLDGESMPEGLPPVVVRTNWGRALAAAAAAGKALIFVGSSTAEPGVEDTSQEELLLACMAFLKTLARVGGLEMFFILRSTMRYAGMLGLLRAAAKEHPELRLRILRWEEDAKIVLPATAGEFICTRSGVVAPRLQRCAAPTLDVEPRRARCALVTGGLRGLGFAVAQRLASTKRADALVLVGRRAPEGSAADRLRELSQRIPVQVVLCDVASWEQVSKLPSHCDLVIHCAGAVKDGVLINLTDDDALKVLRPKIRGTIHLRTKYPDAKKIAFSSSSGLFGVPGQSTYAAGNTFVDACMHSIQWGGWGETGMVEDHGIEPLPGERFFTVEKGVECLFRVLDSLSPPEGGDSAEHEAHEVPYAVLDVDWPVYRQQNLFASDDAMLATIEEQSCEVLRLGPAGARHHGCLQQWELCQQHVVSGTAVLPGSAFVSLALHHVSQLLKRQTVQLQDLEFVRPLELTSPRQLNIVVTEGQLRFFSRAVGGEDQPETLHCQCRFLAAPDSLEVFRNRLPQVPKTDPVDDVYAKFAAAGFHYGPDFQGSCFAVSERDATNTLTAATRGFALDPADLDIALQLASLLHPLGFRGAPQGIERIVAKVGSKLTRSRAYLTGAQGVDVQLFDDGELVCDVEGLTLSSMHAGAHLTSCRPHWKDATRMPRGRWLVVGDEAKQLNLSNFTENEDDFHEAVAIAVKAKTIEDVQKCRDDVQRIAAKQRCWLLSIADEGAIFAEAAAEAAVEVGANAVFGSAEDLQDVAPGLGMDAKAVLRAEDEDGGGAQLCVRSSRTASTPTAILATRLDPYVVETDPSQGGKGAQCRLADRKPPGLGQVEIQADLWALNFRDVLVAKGAISSVVAGQSLGIGGECFGKVAAVGEGVTNVAVGDAVIAVPPDGMGSFCTTDARWVFASPPGMTPEEAVAGTCVYATAWNALHWLARIRPQKRVLIHSAAGGVGLAALHLCKRVGCEVYCTASTFEKRKLLLELGAASVFNSRDPVGFEQGIREATAGQGVDVVLNSLSGEAIPASLRLLRACGHFLEIGKRDQYENTGMRLRPFLKGLSYHAAHLDVLMLEQPDLARELLLEVWEALPTLPTLPTKTFGMSDLAGALEYFSKGIHIGKILIAVEPCEVRPRRPSKVAGPKDDIVRQSLQTMLAASEGPGGLLCAPTLDSVTTVDLQSAELVLTASLSVEAAVQVLNPQATCVTLPTWEPIVDLDEWLSLGGKVVAKEEEVEGDLCQWLFQTVAEMSAPIQMDTAFEDAGLDSLSLISLARRLTAKVNKAVSVVNISDHPTPRRLLEFLGGRPQPELARPKVLCLHGFRSNADAMAASMAPLTSRVGFVEWLFVSSPRLASGPSAPGIPQEEAREWWGQPAGPFETGWMAPHFDGFQSSFAVLQGLQLAGAVGFSQGGGVAALLDCPWLVLCSPVVAPGMKANNAKCLLTYDPTEEYVEQCLEVGTKFPNKQVHHHGGGHTIPIDADFMKLFIELAS